MKKHENDENAVSAEVVESVEITESTKAADTVTDESAVTSEAVKSEEDKKIDDAVMFINETANKTVYKGSIKIGAYVLEHFFENDISLASSKNPKKAESYKKLCDREDLLLSPMHLSQMVRVVSQEKFLKDKGVNTAGLTYTHKASLTKLENDDTKISLINSCRKNKWSTRDLDKKIDAKLKELASNSEISLIRKTSSYLKAIDKFPELEASVSEKGAAMLNGLKPKQRETLEKKLNALKAGVEKISKKSDTIKGFCDTLLEGLSAVAVNEQSGDKQDKEVSEKSES